MGVKKKPAIDSFSDNYYIFLATKTNENEKSDLFSVPFFSLLFTGLC